MAGAALEGHHRATNISATARKVTALDLSPALAPKMTSQTHAGSGSARTLSRSHLGVLCGHGEGGCRREPNLDMLAGRQARASGGNAFEPRLDSLTAGEQLRRESDLRIRTGTLHGVSLPNLSAIRRQPRGTLRRTDQGRAKMRPGARGPARDQRPIRP